MTPAQIIDLVVTALANKVSLEIDIHIRLGEKEEAEEE
jgi:hypothetical protein